MILVVCFLAFIALCVIGAVIEVLTAARYAPHRPVPRAGRAEVVGDVGWYDEIVVEPEIVNPRPLRDDDYTYRGTALRIRPGPLLCGTCGVDLNAQGPTPGCKTCDRFARSLS